MQKKPVPGLHVAAVIGMCIGWTVVLVGPFEHKFVLWLMVPAALFVGLLIRDEYRRGVRAIDSARDAYLPIAEKRSRAVRILADRRCVAPDEVREAVDALSDDEIGTASPMEIACMAVRYLDPG